jgi:hypothetical protein
MVKEFDVGLIYQLILAFYLLVLVQQNELDVMT